MIFRFCPERESFLFPPGAEVTLPCLSATLLGSVVVNRLAFLGMCWFDILSFILVNNDVSYISGRLVIRLGIGSEELAFLSALALLSPDALGGGLLPGHSAMLREFEAKVLQAFHSHMQQRWSTRPYLVGKLIAVLADIRALQCSVPLQAWLEPAGSTLFNT